MKTVKFLEHGIVFQYKVAFFHVLFMFLLSITLYYDEAQKKLKMQKKTYSYQNSKSNLGEAIKTFMRGVSKKSEQETLFALGYIRIKGGTNH